MLSHRKRRQGVARTEAEELVLTTISQHADALLRTARRHSLCADDASDAYQRGLEIFLRNAGRVDAARAASWLHKVIKHEAMAVRRSRQKLVGAEEFDGDALESIEVSAPEDRLVAFEDVTRAAEAIQTLKPQEIRALWLRMEGRTYKEIAADLGWTYTKVNRCVTEGRRAFLARYAGIESGDECRRYEAAISAFVDGELKGSEINALRRHLRGCGGCRSTMRSLRAGHQSLQLVFPVALAVDGLDGGSSALGVFVRVYETLVHHVQERAVTVAAKAQFAVEASGAAKAVAVAGAAAAVAGGGAATVERVAAAEQAPQRSTHAHVQRTPAAVASPPAVQTTSASPPAAAAPIVVRAVRSPETKPTSRPATEFAVERAVEREPSATSTQPEGSSRSSRASGGEFDLE
jgi:RNA polymerase sigma factor (sigma-70 family)